MKGINYDLCLEMDGEVTEDKNIVQWLNDHIGVVRAYYRGGTVQEKQALATFENARFGNNPTIASSVCYAVGENWVYWLGQGTANYKEWIEFDDKNDLMIAALAYNPNSGDFS